MYTARFFHIERCRKLESDLRNNELDFTAGWNANDTVLNNINALFLPISSSEYCRSNRYWNTRGQMYASRILQKANELTRNKITETEELHEYLTQQLAEIDKHQERVSWFGGDHPDYKGQTVMRIMFARYKLQEGARNEHQHNLILDNGRYVIK